MVLNTGPVGDVQIRFVPGVCEDCTWGRLNSDVSGSYSGAAEDLLRLECCVV